MIKPYFVRKGCVSCRLVTVGTAPRLQERNRKEGEGKRARGEDVKMWGQEGKRARGEGVKVWRCEDVKMWRCEDEKMWRWVDVKMWRCDDEQMWRWEDVKMWRWEDVKMRRCEDKKMWRWEDVKMGRWDTDLHYWKNPALRRSREKKLSHFLPQKWTLQTIHGFQNNLERIATIANLATNQRPTLSKFWWLKKNVISICSQLAVGVIQCWLFISVSNHVHPQLLVIISYPLVN